MARDRDDYTDEPPRRRRDDDYDSPRRRDDDYDDFEDRGRRRSVGDIPNYLVQAILVTLFCCLPGGIVAIIYAAQVNGKLAAGDTRGALEASGNAKMWSWIAFGVGLPLQLLVVVLQIVLQSKALR